MGNTISLSSCVSTANTPLESQSYTIIRTSGAAEKGWSITDKHICGGNTNAGMYAYKDVAKNNTWRIFMQNNETDPNIHVCGWRSLETIWPTNLTGDDIMTWRKITAAFLDELDTARIGRAFEAETKFFRTVVYVKSQEYGLFGYYKVKATKKGYEFTLERAIDEYSRVGEVVTVPSMVNMGVGDFIGVTPERIAIC